MKYELLLCPVALCLAGGLALAQTAGNSPATSATCSFARPGVSAERNPNILGSRGAIVVLADTNQARSAIAQGNPAMAKACINDGLNAIQQIQGSRPGTRNTASNLVPIFMEFGQVSVLGPIQQQQQRSGRWQANNQTGAPGTSARSGTPRENLQRRPGMGEAARESENAAAPTVQGVVQEVTDVTLDVNMAKNHLQAANRAIDENQPGVADAALAAVQDGVAMTYVAMDRPLVDARQNLMLARTAVQQGQYANVAAPLQAAADALNEYQSLNSDHSADAANLSREIRAYCSSFTATGDHTGAAQKIEQWWDETRNWSR